MARQKISPSLITGFGNKNILMNGNMQVFQRSEDTFSGTNTTKYVLDRWRYSASNDGAVTVTQSTDVPSGQGFPNSFKVDVTTVDTSLANDQLAHIQTAVEGQDLQHLAYGTSSAKTLTVSFWVKSNKTGTYCFALRKPDNTAYNFVKEYTISSADTWEKKEIRIEPDSNIKATAGAIDDDNGLGFRVIWVLMDGPNRDGATNNTWNQTDDNTSTSNQVNLLDNTSNEFYLTGCQLEVGDTATDFDFVPYRIELQRCKRYYQRWQRQANYAGIGLLVPFSSTGANVPVFLECEPRSSPTVSHSAGSHFDYFGITGTGASGNPSSLQNNGWGGGNVLDLGVTSTGFTIARGYLFEPNNSSGNVFIAFESEL
jgi:hypothetical protein